MTLGSSLYSARKRKGITQEAAAERLGVSRQTISKWETDETLPDIRQAKSLALLYGLSLDELVSFDISLREIQEAIDRTSDAVTQRVDWTKAWGRRYPILLQYQQQVEVPRYAIPLEELLEDLKGRYGYGELDAFLVLKDILAAVWKERKQK